MNRIGTATSVLLLLVLAGGVVLGFMLANLAGTPADAAPMQVVTGRYVPLVRRDWLIVVDTQTGRAWKEIPPPEGEGSILALIPRTDPTGKPE